MLEPHIDPNTKEIVLARMPQEDVKGGLEIEWKPTAEWIKKNPSVYPIANTDIRAGVKIYPIPKGVSPSDIVRVEEKRP